MAISGKYGKLDIPNIGDDEPVFILRAKDRLAGPMVEIYRVMTEAHDRGMSEDLAKQIKAFADWPGPRKLPD